MNIYEIILKKVFDNQPTNYNYIKILVKRNKVLFISDMEEFFSKENLEMSFTLVYLKLADLQKQET